MQQYTEKTLQTLCQINNATSTSESNCILHFTANNVMPNFPYWTPKFGSYYKNSDVYQE